MIEHIPELEESGITSYKIEGRVKSAYYTAVVTNTYRMAIDAYRRAPAGYKFDKAWLNELDGVSHREYGTGFYFTPPSQDANTVHDLGYIREKAYIASAVSDAAVPDENGMYYALFIQRNKVTKDDTVELITPGQGRKSVFSFVSLRCSGRENRIRAAPVHVFQTESAVSRERGRHPSSRRKLTNEFFRHTESVSHRSDTGNYRMAPYILHGTHDTV